MNKCILGKLSLSILSLLFAATAGAETIKIVGSDIVAEKIGDAIKERIKERSIDAVLEMGGTRQAIMDLRSGAAKIAIIALPDGTKAPEGFQTVPYANQIAAIIVNSANPIEEISVEQLGHIFAAEDSDRNESWQTLGVRDIATLRNIAPMSVSLKESLAQEIFKNKALGGANISLKIEIKQTTPLLAEAVKNSSNAIGIASYDPKVENVKVLAVSSPLKTANTFAFKPTVENVHNGDYPLSLKFCVAFKNEDVAQLKPILQILFDDSVIAQLEKGGLLPAPKSFMRSYLMELNIGR